MTLEGLDRSALEVPVFKLIFHFLLLFVVACGGADVGEPGGPGSAAAGGGPSGEGGGAAGSAANRGADQPGSCPGARESFEGWVIDDGLARRLGEGLGGGGGPIPVKYEDCRLSVVEGCRVKGSYSFRLIDRTKYSEYIYHEGDLFRLMPFDGPGFRAEFAERDFWILDAVVVGVHRSSVDQVSADELGASCAGATHFVSRLDTGAFRLKNQIGPAQDRNSEPVRIGGVYERCVLTASDATSEACSRVAKVALAKIAVGPPMPKSDPHPALDSFPGSQQGVRLEATSMGQRLSVPARGKVTVLAFWSAACPPCERVCAEERAAGEKLDKRCKKALKECEACSEEEVFEPSKRALEQLDKLARTSKGRPVEVIGAAVGLDQHWARRLLVEVDVSFPQLFDDEQRKLARRYHVEDGFPAIFVLDRKGTIRFFADGTSDDFGRLDATVESLLAE